MTEPKTIRNDTISDAGLKRFSYSPSSVIAGWRAYILRDNVRVNEPKFSISGIGPDQLACPSDPEPDAINVRHLMWLKVETFFSRFFWLHHHRATLLHDEHAPAGFMAEFEAWYERHPLIRVYTGDSVRSWNPENECYPLKEAVERWNASQKRQVTYAAARQAVREINSRGEIIPPRLHAWRPDGKWTTTMGEIRRWIDSDARETKMEIA